MSDSELVSSRLGDEEIVATVTLNGEDELVVTPTRSLLYRAEGILSDESVTEYPHEIDRIDVSTGRRKASLELHYPIEGTESLAVPKGSLESVLHYLMAGVLNVKGVTQPGESMRAVYRFNELTVIVTSERVVTNVGSSVWDEEFDQYRYADLTGFEIEEGSVATQFVLYIDGRSQRIKVPKGRAVELKQDLTDAVFAYFDVDSMAALHETISVAEPEEERDALTFEDGVEPLTTTSTSDRSGETSVDFEPSPPAETIHTHDRRELEAAIEQLQDVLEQQAELVELQQQAIDDLVATLTRDQ